MKRLISLKLCLFFLILPLLGQETGSQGTLSKSLTAIRIHSEINIDGLLTEALWEEAAPATDFTQSEPYEGRAATERTEVRVLYDDENIYFGIYCHTSDPDQLIVNDLRRDFQSPDGDSFEIILDTFDDDRNGFLFVTNPESAKLDAQLANDGRDVNTDWDGVWHVRSSVNRDGWSSEMVIPFKTLRFSKTGTGTWGINFLRRIRRKNEIDTWFLIPRRYLIEANSYRVSLAGELLGLEGMKQGRNIKVTPFAVASLEEISTEGRSVEADLDAGVDVKYGVTSGLTLDATLNTDFSQVEADEQQINLTRFPLFFPEKRDFFLENAGIFQFGDVPLERGPDRSRETQVFFSRRIGLSQDEEPVPILGGARLSGRAGPFTLGLLNLQTKKADPAPGENFAVIRVKRDIFASSDVGAIFINRQSSLVDDHNRSYGFDANLRFFQNLTFNSYVAQTQTPGLSDEDSIWKVASQWRDNFLRLQLVYADIEENFNPEVGFVRRTGVKSTRARIEFHPRPSQNRLIREFHPHAIARYFTDQENRTLTKINHFGLEITFQDGTQLEFKRDDRFERLDDPFDIRPEQPELAIPIGDYSFTQYAFEFVSDRSKPIFANFTYQAGDFFNGERTSWILGGTVRPTFKLSFDFSYQRNDFALTGGDFLTNLLLLRTNYSFNPRMFLTALIQYNSDIRKVSSNLRFNFIHRPLSDLFVVYNERRAVSDQREVDRIFSLKYTHLLEF